MQHMVRVVPAFHVRFFLRVFALLQMIEKSVIGHDVARIKRTLDGTDLLTHYKNIKMPKPILLRLALH